MSHANRRYITLALKLVVSIALIGWLLHSVGAEDALGRMLELEPLWFAIAFGVGSLQMVIGALRWQVVLRGLGEPVRWQTVFRLTYIGSFFNQTLPSSVGGDAVRGYMAYKSGMAARPVITSILIDRVVTVLALVALAVVMIPFGAAELEGGEWVEGGLWLVFALAVGGTIVLMLMDRVPENIARLRIINGLTHLAADSRQVLLRFPYNVSSMAVSVLGHANLATVVYALALGLGIEITLMDCLLLFPPVLLIQTVPISVAGWGVREGAMVALFSLIGIAAESILALSILYGLILILINLPGVVLWVMSGRVNMKDAEAFAER